MDGPQSESPPPSRTPSHLAPLFKPRSPHPRPTSDLTVVSRIPKYEGMVMEKYEFLSVVGEGAYGKVLKCKHRETGQIVAIKKFLETEEDQVIRKVALREIRVLKKLRHDNLVCMIDVFRRKKRFFLVFEYVYKTLLTVLQEEKDLNEGRTRRFIFQIFRGLDFCHENNIVHRDLKPENILVTKTGVVKLCDFGFARFVALNGEPCTDYVATRWYRAPELLVGDTHYGRPVDVWSCGCLIFEMLTGHPLFPGESDLDQLFRIMKLVGDLTETQIRLVQQTLLKNEDSFYSDPLIKIEEAIKSTDYEYKKSTFICLKEKFPKLYRLTLEISAGCLAMDPNKRLTTTQLLQHKYFHHDNFAENFLIELQKLVESEDEKNPLKMKVLSLNKLTNGKSVQGSRRKCTAQAPEWNINLSDFQNKQLNFSSLTPKELYQKECGKTHSSIHGSVSVDRKESSGCSTFDSFDKISMTYKRDIMPNTQTIKVINGRLVPDKQINIPSNRYQPRRYVCEEDFSLPDIQGVNDAKKKKKEVAEVQPPPSNLQKPKHANAFQTKQKKLRRLTLAPKGS